MSICVDASNIAASAGHSANDLSHLPHEPRIPIIFPGRKESVCAIIFMVKLTEWIQPLWPRAHLNTSVCVFNSIGGFCFASSPKLPTVHSRCCQGHWSLTRWMHWPDFYNVINTSVKYWHSITILARKDHTNIHQQMKIQDLVFFYSDIISVLAEVSERHITILQSPSLLILTT